MNDIDINAKTDRELLIMVVEKLNAVCHEQKKIDRWVHGNGVPGAKFQLYILWAVFLAILAKLVKGV